MPREDSGATCIWSLNLEDTPLHSAAQQVEATRFISKGLNHCAAFSDIRQVDRAAAAGAMGPSETCMLAGWLFVCGIEAMIGAGLAELFRIARTAGREAVLTSEVHNIEIRVLRDATPEQVAAATETIARLERELEEGEP